MPEAKDEHRQATTPGPDEVEALISVRDAALRALERKERELEDARLVADARAARLAEKERELSELKRELAKRNFLAARNPAKRGPS